MRALTFPRRLALLISLSSMFMLVSRPVLASEASPKSTLNFEEAIQVAEKFIASQGYTDKKIALDKDNLVREAADAGMKVAAVAEKRKGLLNKEAVGARRVGRTRYVVAFRYAGEEAQQESGKAVMVSRSGKEIKISDADVKLEGFFRTESEWLEALKQAAAS